MAENKFVFVVCGAREHIETLHFSLKAISRFSLNEVIVVTDTTRNEIPVDWGKILDIKTPENLNHHQASIYLKTSLHKYLPPQNSYCYLDTDVVAVSKEIDSIFSHYVSPITFCSDHCRLNFFSPHSVNCSCVIQTEVRKQELIERQKKLMKMLGEWEELERRRIHLSELIHIYRSSEFNWSGLDEAETANLQAVYSEWKNKYELKDYDSTQESRNRLLNLFGEIKKNPLLMPVCVYKILRNYKRNSKLGGWYERKSGKLVYHEFAEFSRYLLSHPEYHLENSTGKICNRKQKWAYDPQYAFNVFFGKYPEYKWVEAEQKWYDSDGNLPIDSNRTFGQYFAKEGFYYNKEKGIWHDEEGTVIVDENPPINVITITTCMHLHEQALAKFNISIHPPDWQHWNGGVFLFDERSHTFLDWWHEATLKIFDDGYWKTRDQGTLAVAAWKFGLQNNPMLPLEFNFIADYNHNTMIYLGNLSFYVDPKRKKIKPHFIHIYHHWGDTDWEVWRDVYSFINS